MESVIQTKDLSVGFDGQTVLEHIDLTVPANTITAIIGPSGCGKTTLLKCFNGMVQEEGAAVSGSVMFRGAPLDSIPNQKLRRHIGLVFQQPVPFPFSIYKNMAYAPKYYGVKKSEIDALVREKLDVAGLYSEVEGNLDRSALTLSGGQQQRLCIARALTSNPEVLLLDEPCSALDVHSTTQIEEMLKQLARTTTIVVVTHNLAQAKRIANHLVFICDHTIVEQGPAQQLFEDPADERTRLFLSNELQ